MKSEDEAKKKPFSGAGAVAESSDDLSKTLAALPQSEDNDSLKKEKKE